MFWKTKCRKAAYFLLNYNWQDCKSVDIKTVVETVAGMLSIPVSCTISPRDTSCRILELIMDFPYHQSEDVLFPLYLRQSREERLAFVEYDYGKFYEALYKYESDEQRYRVCIIQQLSVFRGVKRIFDYQTFFFCLGRYLQCVDNIDKAEMQSFLVKSLHAVLGVYLEQNGHPDARTWVINSGQNKYVNLIGFARNVIHNAMWGGENYDTVYEFIGMIADYMETQSDEVSEIAKKKMK